MKAPSLLRLMMCANKPEKTILGRPGAYFWMGYSPFGTGVLTPWGSGTQGYSRVLQGTRQDRTSFFH